ncbi:hypothetical protein HB774_02625 [Rhizobium leguminosarum bv. viciae]|nr:hypothetical protein HB774_02625 [Rhizobium leguminosarum bv. viciae]
MTRGPESYVAATRRLRPEVIAREHYRRLFEVSAMRLAEVHGIEITFFATYSTERTCETVQLGGETCVIFDVGLSDTFLELNRIWTCSIGAEEVRELCLRYMAEYAQITGRLDLAFALAKASDEAKRHIGFGRAPSDHILRARVTNIQERYVLYHEACHAVLAADPSFKESTILAVRTSFVYDYVVPELKRMEEIVDRGVMPEAQAQHLLAMVNQWMSVQWKDDAVVEECICDNLAIRILFDDLKDMPGLSPWEFVLSVLFASRHQETLSELRNIIDRFDSARTVQPDWMEPGQIRSAFVRWELSKHFADGVFGSGFDFDKLLSGHSMQYYNHITSPVRVVAQEIEAMDRRLWRYTADAGRMILLNAEIDAILGQREIKAEAEWLGEAAFTFRLGDTQAFDRVQAVKDALFRRVGGP